MNGHNDGVAHIIQINKKMLASISSDTVKFWNLDNYQNILTINDVTPFSWSKNGLIYLEKENLLLIGGEGIIYIIDLNNYKIIKKITEEDFNLKKQQLCFFNFTIYLYFY